MPLIGLTMKSPQQKKAILQCVDQNDALCRKRLNPMMNHQRAKSRKIKVEKKHIWTSYGHPDCGRCIVCRGKCNQNSSTFGSKCGGRCGRKTVHYCIGCKVYLCNLCWTSFRSDEIQELLPCTDKKLGLATRRLLRFDVDQPKHWNPGIALI